MNSKKYDVIVIGGGLVGLLQTALLAQNNLNVLCLDKQTENDFKNSPHSKRTTAISYGSSLLLQRANLWNDVLKNACPIEKIHVADGTSPILLNFDINETEEKAFGWVIENHYLRDALINNIQGLKTATYITGDGLHNFISNPDTISITTVNDQSYSASLLIGADGRGSKIRELAKIETENYSYSQKAIISIVTHENPHHNHAVEHFKKSGPFAILPMLDDKNGQHRSSIVWTEENNNKNSILNYDEATYMAGLKARFPASYGEILSTTERISYPLGFIHAHNYTTDRVALIGDAAHGIHPIAGQGLNLGLRDVTDLSDLIIAAHNNKDDIGSNGLLKNYEQHRRPDNDLMAFATDSINRIFSNNRPITRFGRKIGLKLIDQIPSAKKVVLSHMMGQKQTRKN